MEWNLSVFLFNRSGLFDPVWCKNSRWINTNLLTPNVNYSGRTAPLTSKVAFYIFIQQIYVLNILNIVYTLPFFSSKCSLFHNFNVFGSCIIHILYTGCAKIKKNNSGAKRLTLQLRMVLGSVVRRIVWMWRYLPRILLILTELFPFLHMELIWVHFVGEHYLIINLV